MSSHLHTPLLPRRALYNPVRQIYHLYTSGTVKTRSSLQQEHVHTLQYTLSLNWIKDKSKQKLQRVHRVVSYHEECLKPAPPRIRGRIDLSALTWTEPGLDGCVNEASRRMKTAVHALFQAVSEVCMFMLYL